MSGIREAIGWALGTLLAPVTASLSAARRARMFHPRGIVVRAEVRAVGHDPLGESLAGPAIVRLSSAWWKRREWKDVLGLALRLTDHERPDAHARPGDQDLLLATIKRPWTMPFAPFTTRHHDFLANEYYAVSPFRIDGLGGEIELRIVPAHTVSDGASRRERLERAIARRDAVLILELRRYRRLLDRRREPWRAIARVELRRIVALDDDDLRFDPFHTGRGIHPVGAIHAMRISAYAASQGIRPRAVQRRSRERATADARAFDLRA